MGPDLAVLDTETTDLDPDRGSRLCELAILRIEAGRCVNVFHRFWDPGVEPVDEARALHGYTRDGLLSQFRPFAAVDGTDILEAVRGAVLVAHGLPFDAAHLLAELSRVGWAAQPSGRSYDAPEPLGLLGQYAAGYVDTRRLAAAVDPGQSARLDDVCARYGIAVDPRRRHGALEDARLCWEIYQRLTEVRHAA